MQIKRVDEKGWALCENKNVDAKGGIMMYKFKGWMEKIGQYDVELKR